MEARDAHAPPAVAARVGASGSYRSSGCSYRPSRVVVVACRWFLGEADRFEDGGALTSLGAVSCPKIMYSSIREREYIIFRFRLSFSVTFS